MNNRLVALSLAILGATVFVPSAQAQRHMASGPAGRPGTAGARLGSMRAHSVPLRRARQFSSGSAFAPYFYSDYGYDYEPETVEPPPGPIVERTAEPDSPAPVPDRTGALVLELQDDHWVRITNSGQSQSDGQSSVLKSAEVSKPSSDTTPATVRRTAAGEPASTLPKAVLVFRDGHQEEIRKYMIVGTTIYTSSDSWDNNSWTRKVQIAELDVPATLERNQERGAKFSLPSGPNEVMIRQ